MTRPRFRSDQSDDLTDLIDRVKRLEIARARQSIDFTAAALPLSLGSFDGESIQGIRITINGRITGGGNFYLRPNGLASIATACAVYTRDDYNGSTAAQVASGFSQQTLPGLYVGSAVWVTGAEMISSTGVVFTRAPAVGSSFDPNYVGLFYDRDDSSNGNRASITSVGSTWSDGSPITSLELAQTGGAGSPALTGRITTETF